ncbi:MAG: Gfo/Idh/MocA family oxidoreductase [Caldilineaceae bacterium]|nr:Gfo/Idh/MocA family oxidoreductase [Caldilineaceae bacterium]
MELRSALIGCGGLGKVHAQMVQQLGTMKMAAFCDVDGGRAEQLRQEFGGDYATSDPETIFRDPTIQVVYICTHHDTHAEYCIRAAQAGKHIMVEKPLALTTEACIAIGQAVEETGVKLMTAFKMRYFTLIQKVKELIPNPLMVTMQMMDNRWPDEMWANDPIKGGGNVLSQGVHSCDILRYVAGSDPVSVYAVGANYYQKTGVIDNMAAVYQFANGVTGNLVQGDANCPPHVSKFYMQVFAENKSATLSSRLTTLTYQEKGQEPVIYPGTETGFLEENRDFIRALQEDRPMPIDHRDGLLATLMILQGFKSIETGQPQPIAALLGA